MFVVPQTVSVSLREQKRRDAAWAAAKSEQKKRMAELQALEQQIEHLQVLQPCNACALAHVEYSPCARPRMPIDI